jgi:hypothetical protein
MRNHLLFILAMVSITACAQDTEFTIHDNGLIYDEQTMARLGHIVDSLNLRFKTCEPNDYRSLEQGFATVVILEKDIAGAKQAMSKNIPLEKLLRQFPHAEHRREWIVKFQYTDYRNKAVIEYASLPLRNDNGLSVSVTDRHANDKNNGWIFEEEGGTLAALYLGDVRSRPLPAQYAQLIQYVDCMIDTTAQIYLTKDNPRKNRELPPDSKITQYVKFATDFRDEPQMPEIDWDSPFAEAQYNKYNREYAQWNNRRLARLDEKMKSGHYYKVLLAAAMDEAIENGAGDETLEFYVERYRSPTEALKMKRHRQPIGRCSMDQGPRMHAQSICRLAAETTQWDIFFRAHLDIMNDNFERVSDGSYAWKRRGTYLKELEELDIDVLDLMIGTSLRSSNVSGNHYLGDIGRVGRALSETSEKEELERRLLSMVEDKELDLYNRLLMAYVFDNYNHHLPDDVVRKKNNDIRFRNAVATLPEGIGRSFQK